MSGSNIREALVKVAQWGIDGTHEPQPRGIGQPVS